MAELTRQIRNITGNDEFKRRLEKKYGRKIVDTTQEQGFPVYIFDNGDAVRAWDEKKLIGNPFGPRGARGAHFTMTKYSEAGYRKAGSDKFTTNYAMKFGAGTLAYAKSLSLTPAQIRKAEAMGIGNADDERLALREFMDSLKSGSKSFKKVLDMPTTLPKSSVSSRLAKFKSVSLGNNPKFTGTRGEMDAMDKPDLFKKRYIDNLEAHLENIQWRLSNDIYGDAPVQSLLDEAERVLDDLKVAKRMSASEWDAYIAVFRKSPMDKIPMVSNIKPVKPKQEVKLVSPAMAAIYGEKRAREIAESNRKDIVERFKYAELDGDTWVDTRTGKKFAWKGEYPDLEPSSVADLQSIHDSRSSRSRESDERQSNADTIEPDDPRVEQWVKDQGRLDIVNIDTPRRHKGKKVARKARKSTRTETQVRGIGRR